MRKRFSSLPGVESALFTSIAATNRLVVAPATFRTPDGFPCGLSVDSIPHVLVVDDDAGIRNALAALIGAWGYEVDSAGSGSRALELALARRPAAVFVDLCMPGMNGYQLAGWLKTSMGDSCPVLFAISADIAEAADHPLFDRMFHKPVEPTAIKHVLHHALHDACLKG